MKKVNRCQMWMQLIRRSFFVAGFLDLALSFNLKLKVQNTELLVPPNNWLTADNCMYRAEISSSLKTGRLGHLEPWAHSRERPFFLRAKDAILWMFFQGLIVDGWIGYIQVDRVRYGVPLVKKKGSLRYFYCILQSNYWWFRYSSIASVVVLHPFSSHT